MACGAGTEGSVLTRGYWLLRSLALAIVLVGCGRSEDAPLTNPLATEPPGTLTASASPIAGSGETGAPAAGPDAEAAAAQAIEVMAEWLSIPPSELRVLAIEAVEWPDACLGVALSGESCAEVVAPGWQVVLSDALEGAHTIHLGSGGAARWAGEITGEIEVLEADAGASTLVVRLDAEERVVRGAAGTRGLAIADLAPGDRLTVGFDASPDDPEVLVAAWLARLDEP